MSDIYTCGNYAYSCQDPTVSTDCSSSTSYAPTLTSISSASCISYYIGDGYCDSTNNTEDCDWDGGE